MGLRSVLCASFVPEITHLFCQLLSEVVASCSFLPASSLAMSFSSHKSVIFFHCMGIVGMWLGEQDFDTTGVFTLSHVRLGLGQQKPFGLVSVDCSSY